MKIKVFFITCAGSAIILVASSMLVFTQMRAVQDIGLDTLTESLYQEDAKILSWILSSVPLDRVETMTLPESWAEIFVVNNSDLVVVSSTKQGRRGLPLYRHPDLLDQGSMLMDAMRAGKTSTVNTPDYMVVIRPAGAGQSIIALKPKAWEKNLVSRQNAQIDRDASRITCTMLIFIGAGLCITFLVSLLIAFVVVNPTLKIRDAFEALSLGDFDHEVPGTGRKDMKAFMESYLRLKTSLTMALERIQRR